MDKRIIIDNSLSDHISFLEQSGYKVEKVNDFNDTSSMQSFNYDAIVVANKESFPMDATSYRPGAPIVEAKDKTPEELFNILRGRY